LGEAALAAVPVIGAIAVVGFLAYEYFSAKPGGPKTEGRRLEPSGQL
jgi:hypothetical protein